MSPSKQGDDLFPRMPWWGVGLVLMAVVLSVAMLVVSASRELSTLEGTLFQIMILAAGLSGSFVTGRRGASAAAREVVKPAARSAFRRVLWLYGSMTRLSEALGEPSQDGAVPHRVLLARAILQEQMNTVSDVMEDWRDLVPEDVNDIERQLKARRAHDLEVAP